MTLKTRQSEAFPPKLCLEDVVAALFETLLNQKRPDFLARSAIADRWTNFAQCAGNRFFVAKAMC
jgi:hypothetical protein